MTPVLQIPRPRPAAPALRFLDRDVWPGEVVALLGAGAGAALQEAVGGAGSYVGPGRAAELFPADLLVLDDPTAGLHAPARRAFWRYVADLRTTVLLTTDDLDEVDRLVDRVVVLDHGEVVADDSADALRAETGDVVRLTTTSPLAAVRTARTLTEVQSAHVDGSLVTLRVADGPGLLPRLLPELSGVSSATVQRATLTDVVEDLTGASCSRPV